MRIQLDPAQKSMYEIHTPAKKVIPAQALLLCERSHDDESVKIDPLTEHPEIVASHHVLVKEVQNLATYLLERNEET